MKTQCPEIFGITNTTSITPQLNWGHRQQAGIIIIYQMMTSYAALTSNTPPKRFDSFVFMVRECNAIENLRNDITACTKDLQEACYGKTNQNDANIATRRSHFDGYHFVSVMSLLQANILSCERNLDGAWFSGFIKVGMNGKREMVTTIEIRKVSDGGNITTNHAKNFLRTTELCFVARCA